MQMAGPQGRVCRAFRFMHCSVGLFGHVQRTSEEDGLSQYFRNICSKSSTRSLFDWIKPTDECGRSYLTILPQNPENPRKLLGQCEGGRKLNPVQDKCKTRSRQSEPLKSRRRLANFWSNEGMHNNVCIQPN